jgi:hypothetical protein
MRLRMDGAAPPDDAKIHHLDPLLQRMKPRGEIDVHRVNRMVTGA